MPQMKPYAKAAAYMGLVLVTPVSGWVCFKLGQYIDAHAGTTWVAITGLIIGCAAGMYETYREAMRIEGLTSLTGKSSPDTDDGDDQSGKPDQP